MKSFNYWRKSLRTCDYSTKTACAQIFRQQTAEGKSLRSRGIYWNLLRGNDQICLLKEHSIISISVWIALRLTNRFSPYIVWANKRNTESLTVCHHLILLSLCFGLITKQCNLIRSISHIPRSIITRMWFSPGLRVPGTLVCGCWWKKKVNSNCIISSFSRLIKVLSTRKQQQITLIGIEPFCCAASWHRRKQ